LPNFADQGRNRFLKSFLGDGRGKEDLGPVELGKPPLFHFHFELGCGGLKLEELDGTGGAAPNFLSNPF
jgi:hypothetical protein